MLAAGLAGAAVGYAGWGTMAAAQLGWTVGVAAFSLLGPKPEGPGPGDLSASGLNLGSQIPRPYGRVRLTVNPIWVPDQYRATAHEADGKGAPSGPTSYTYDTDVLGLVCDGTRVVAVTREWWDKKLISTALSDSSAASISASLDTAKVASVTDQLGGSTQMPWSVYEDYVGTPNASAYRGMFTRGYAGVQCGSNKTLPFIEVEVITAGTPDPGDVFWLVNAGATEAPEDSSSWGNSVTATNVQPIVDSNGYGGYSFANTAASGQHHRTFTESTTTIFQWNPSTENLTLESRVHIGADPDVNINLLVAGDLGSSQLISAYIADDFAPDLKRIVLNVLGQTATTDSVGPAGYEDLVGGFGMHHWAIDYDAETKTATLYRDGVVILVKTYSGTLPLSVNMKYYSVASFAAEITPAANILRFDGARFTRRVRRYPSAFTPPTVAPSDDSTAVWTPGLEYLDDVILAELAQHPTFDPADVDVTDIADIEVRGYVAIGAPEKTVAELCDMFYVGVVPGNPIKFVKRGQSSVATIPWRATGAAVGQPGEGLDGLSRMGNDEVPGVKALAYPDINRDHNPGFQRGDRLTTDGPDIQRIETRVVLTAEEAKGRAISSALLERMSRHTSEFGLSDYYAESEPEDVYLTTDREGNTYRQRIKSYTYADGVRQVAWELDDPNSYLLTAGADMSDEPSIEVAPSANAEWQAMDLPQLQDADNSPGYYLAVKTDDESVAFGYESPDNASYTSVQRFEQDAVFGPVTAVSGTLVSGNLFDEAATITVDVGNGTLASSTRNSLLADRNVNAFAIVSPAGVCRVVGQFRTATVLGDGVYRLSGLLLDRWESARFVSEVAANDVFCLLRSTGGLARISRTVAQLGAQHYVKAVAIPRVVASIDGVPFTAAGVSQKPPAPMQLRKTLDASTGDATYTFNRCTRSETRFGGDLGDSVPLGEATEAYRITFYTDGDFDTVIRTEDVTTAAFSYTAAQRTTDYGSSTATAYVGIAQISATVGAGFELRTTA